MDIRVFVEKRKEFNIEEKSLLDDLNSNLKLNLNYVKYLNIYDVFGIDKELLEKAKYLVFGEIQTDDVYFEYDYSNYKALAIEYLPGQFDQRGVACADCLRLIDPNTNVTVRSAKLYLFDKEVSDDIIIEIENYLINKVESQKKNLDVLSFKLDNTVKEVKVLDGFRSITDYSAKVKEFGLAMNDMDLKEVVNYFNKEGRDPYETELRILDTYWSDHCRHTTFNTILENISFGNGALKEKIENSFKFYLDLRKETNRENKNICLMDLALICAKALKKRGYLNDLEESEEINACSVFVDIVVDGKLEKWLLQFKNETHNHPTEIEPYGGASTCLGGAIRDPLSGRSYVYQAMRVTGAGNIYETLEETLPNKLPQRKISKVAASGYSSYGNQIGLATTYVKELYDYGFTAKRLEVGAVVGAVKYEDIKRETPCAGDIIVLLGGKTGRDGVGGATGSSKEHTDSSLTTCSSEVQKGNAIEERKIQRLFRNKEVTKLIKKSNDFGAGGVSVAIGELADGLIIDLNKIPVKYLGLNATELAISESQERMAVVIEAKDETKFLEFCHDENIEATVVAKVTDNSRLVMTYNDKKIVDISREFIDSAGAKHYTDVLVNTEISNYPEFDINLDLKEIVKNIMSSKNVLSQKGLVEMFDSTIGKSTVLMPYGGKYQRSESEVSCQLLPTLGHTDSASILAYGYNPLISKSNPYLGSMYAVIESITKLVAAGASYHNIRFSFQEYFQKMLSKEDFGLPFSALLGSIEAQMAFNLPSIGGKDSMSGTFKDLNVPPMLMSFAITLVNQKDVISTDFKEKGNYLYLIKHKELENHLPNYEELKSNFDFVTKNILNKNIVSARSISYGMLVEALFKMAFGNMIGFDVNFDLNELKTFNYGSILVESEEELDYENAIYLGRTTTNTMINGVLFNLEEIYELNRAKFNTVYTEDVNLNSPLYDLKPYKTNNKFKNPLDRNVNVLIPVFPGTNCDYDTAKTFEALGAKTKFFVYKNLTAKDILESTNTLAKLIDETDILVFSGGFSAADEPDGSGKFIANVIRNEVVSGAIYRLLARKCLILGICNGFQALVKSGLLPFSKIGKLDKNSPTLFRNDINRHISKIVRTKVMTNNSPWLQGFNGGEIHSIAVSHGEGKFVCDKDTYLEMVTNGQIAFNYVDLDDNLTNESPYNPNGSYYAIEGIVSKDGLILGKMGHSERYQEGCFKNICGNKQQDIFINAMNYFKKD